MSLRHSSSWVIPSIGPREVPPDEAAALLAALARPADHDQGLPLTILDPHCPPLSLAEAYEICVGITRLHSASFFLSSQLLPLEKRRAVRAFYAFCRTSDDLVDHPKERAEQALARWVHRSRDPVPPPHDPVLLAWGDTAQRYQVPQELINELLAGVAMDLNVKRYASFDDLWLYCYRVASVVGLISMHIIGDVAQARPYAVNLGVALQLTNILRDVGEDAARGRIYLPLEDLARFGLSEADILNGRRDDRFRALMQFQIERADALYEQSWPGIALLARDSQLGVATATEVYRGILAKIVANDYDVFTRRAHLSFSDKLLLLPRIWQRLRKLRRDLAATPA
ncbi:MAG: phytoene/squalene synthase family protein [Roseiflexaceae bacterium]